MHLHRPLVLLLQKREHSGLQSVQCFFFFPTDTLPNHLVQYGTGANLSISTCLHYHIICTICCFTGFGAFHNFTESLSNCKITPFMAGCFTASGTGTSWRVFWSLLWFSAALSLGFAGSTSSPLLDTEDCDSVSSLDVCVSWYHRTVHLIVNWMQLISFVLILIVCASVRSIDTLPWKTVLNLLQQSPILTH